MVTDTHGLEDKQLIVCFNSDSVLEIFIFPAVGR